MGGKRKSGLEMVHWATQYLEEYYAATSTETDVRLPSIQPIRWLPPQDQMYKVNVDEAIFTKLKAIGIGVVIGTRKGNLRLL